VYGFDARLRHQAATARHRGLSRSTASRTSGCHRPFLAPGSTPDLRRIHAGRRIRAGAPPV
jgi:hypothetical protein